MSRSLEICDFSCFLYMQKAGQEPRSHTTDNTELEAMKSELETYKKELLVYKTEYEHSASPDGFFDGLQERVLHLSENPYAEKIAEKQLFLQKEVAQPLSPLPSGDAPEMSPRVLYPKARWRI